MSLYGRQTRIIIPDDYDIRCRMCKRTFVRLAGATSHMYKMHDAVTKPGAYKLMESLHPSEKIVIYNGPVRIDVPRLVK